MTEEYAEALKLTTELYDGNQVAARKWLETPNAYFGNRTPAERLDEEGGFDEVVQLIGRLTHGVYS